MAGFALLAAGFWLGTRQLQFRSKTGVAAASDISTVKGLSDPAKAFWTAFLGNDTNPIIAHADAVFLLDSNNDLFWFPHGESGYRGAAVDPALAQQYAANPALIARA
ncbi:MAG TPA: hypothetical protein VJU82_04705, partial [Acidobacteriaceae bacterium]|nr:hypothetical protein [Acidobacteriaceae bacterium]